MAKSSSMWTIAGVPTPLSYVPVIEESDLSVEMSFFERLYNFYLQVY